MQHVVLFSVPIDGVDLKNQPAPLFRKYSLFFCSRELFLWGTQPHYFELFHLIVHL
jgi:hypothetical protein